MAYIGIHIGPRALLASIHRSELTEVIPASIEKARLPVTFFQATDSKQTTPAYLVQALSSLVNFDVLLPGTITPSIDALTECIAPFRGEVEACLQTPIKGCVMCIPARITQRQTVALRQALWAGGIKRVKTIDSLSAEFIFHQPSLRAYSTVQVCDWTDTGFETGLFRICGGEIQMMAMEASRDIGGDNLDAAILNEVLPYLPPSRAGEIHQQTPEFYRRIQTYTEDQRHKLEMGETVTWNWLEAIGDDSLIKTTPVLIVSAQHQYNIMVERAIQITMEIQKQYRPDAILLAGETSRFIPFINMLKADRAIPLIPSTSMAKSNGAAISAANVPEQEWDNVARAPANLKPLQTAIAAGHPINDPSEDVSAMGKSPVRRSPAREKSRWVDIFVPQFSHVQDAFERNDLVETCNGLAALLKEINKFSANVYDKVSVRLEGMSRADEALNFRRTAYHLDPANIHLARHLVTALHTKALAVRQHNEYKQASTLLNEAINAFDTFKYDSAETKRLHASSLYAYAASLCDTRNYKDAESIMVECVVLAPEVEQYRVELAKLQHSLRVGKSSSANVSSQQTGQNVARNMQCPCGSGKKYKRCCSDKR